MRTTAIALTALVTLTGSLTTQAQQQAPAMPQPETRSSSPVQDCTKAPKRHDHAMEKGMGRSIPNPCTQAQAASAPPAKKLHDHQQVHK